MEPALAAWAPALAVGLSCGVLSSWRHHAAAGGDAADGGTSRQHPENRSCTTATGSSDLAGGGSCSGQLLPAGTSSVSTAGPSHISSTPQWHLKSIASPSEHLASFFSMARYSFAAAGAAVTASMAPLSPDHVTASLPPAPTSVELPLGSLALIRLLFDAVLPTALAEASSSSSGAASATAAPQPPLDAQIRADPAAATAVAVAAPLAYLLRGDVLSPADLAALSDTLASPQLRAALRPWEVAAVAWALACLAPSPSPELKSFLRQAATSPSSAGLEKIPCSDYVTLCWAAAVTGALGDGRSDAEAWSACFAQLSRYGAKELESEPVSALLLLHAALLACPAAATSGPRPTKDEVEAWAQPLPRKLRSRLLAAYDEYAPMQPYVPGAYAVVLQASRLLAASGAATGPVQGLLWGSGTPAGGGQGQGPAACTALLKDAPAVARARRELEYRWRSDQLLDARQKVANDVAYQLSRRLGVTMTQPVDWDVLLPAHRLALVVQDESPAPSAPFSLAAAPQLTALLVRERFAPTGGFARHSWPGLAAAAQRACEARGWRAVTVEGPQWRGLKGDAEKEALLRGLLLLR